MATGDRHPLFEGLVYGLALLLALFVGYHGLRRAFTAFQSPSASRPAASLPAGETRELVGSPTEVAVSNIPPLHLTKDGALRRRGVPAPAPAGKK